MKKLQSAGKRTAIGALAALLLGAPLVAGAQSAAASETTLALIELLVKEGVISVDKARALLAAAEKEAQMARQREAAPAPNTVRVPYVPETVKNEIREELRAEIVQQAKAERWGVPGSLPEWIDRIEWNGDLRVRYQGDRFSDGNFPFLPDAQRINSSGGVTTAAGFPFVNTIDDRNRLRYRARIGANVRVSDSTKAGIKLASGSDNSPTSTNQSMGDYFRKDAIWVDQAFIDYTPFRDTAIGDIGIAAGRMANPFFTTDLVWDSDVNMEGLAVKGFKPWGNPSAKGQLGRQGFFYTLGAFPLQEFERNKNDSWLYAAQAGTVSNFGDNLSVKFGAAYYNFKNVQSQLNAPGGSRLLDYTAPAILGPGNSIFNMRTDGLTTLAGLASQFKLLNLTASARYRMPKSPLYLTFTADYVKNTAMDPAEITRLQGAPGVKPDDKGYLARVAFGTEKIARRGDWEVALGYKRIGSDAVIAAFTDSDFGVHGGTDLKGFTLDANYGIAPNTWIGFSWLSADAVRRPPFAADVLQLNFNTRF